LRAAHTLTIWAPLSPPTLVLRSLAA
jgi:hypothetical protein